MMGAFMTVTAFLSMWISNTATTAMMLPIAVATVKTINGDSDEENSENSDPEADQHMNNLNVSRSFLTYGIWPVNKCECCKAQRSLAQLNFHGGF